MAGAGLLVGPATEIAKCSWEPIRRNFGYLIHYQEHFETLQRELGKLKSKRADIQTDLEMARSRWKKPTNQVNGWLERVLDLERQVAAMETEYRENERCLLNGCCPNYVSRYRLGRNAAKKLKRVIDEQEAAENFDKVAATPPPEPAVEMPAASLGNQAKAPQKIDEILHYLRDESIGTIGIYGMGGVGKTTIMRHVNNRAQGYFDIIIWITVSQDFNLREVQKKIARTTGLTLDEDDKDEWASQIFARLKTMKYLLILDDVWVEDLDLETVGVPKKSKQKGGKVAITTRFLSVCNAMDADVRVNIEVLPWNEAWDLFREKAGGVVVSNSRIKTIAEQLAKECGGLPLAIITVGRAMREKDKVELWQSALTALRRASPSHIPGMENHVFRCLKFSYDSLGDENIKLCFLYCCLYPEDYGIYIRALVVRWIAEGFVETSSTAGGGSTTMDDSINRGHAVLEKIKDACLLEPDDFYPEKEVKMHDLIRDLARWLTSSSSSSCNGEEGPKFMAKARMALTEPPEASEWSDFQRISLSDNDIQELPQQPPDCPQLLTLFLQANRGIQSIPSSFFQHMHSLRLLDLSGTSISSLPPSLSSLGNLIYLDCFGCERLVELAPLGQLGHLQYLYLSCTSIAELPNGLEELENLKILSLNATSKLRKIQPYILGRLTRLEHLKISGYKNWDKDLTEDGSRTSLEELACLTRLTRLEISVGDTGTLNWLVGSVLWNRIKSLGIESCEEIGISWWSRNFNNLEWLSIEDCTNFDKFIIGKDPSFTSLEDLVLGHLPCLYTIWEGPMPHGSFENLQNLIIFGCEQLRYLFSCDMLQHFQNLRYIQVQECPKMEVLIEGQLEEEIALPRLMSLLLWSLEKLQTVYTGVVKFPSLKKYFMKDCPNLIWENPVHLQKM